MKYKRLPIVVSVIIVVVAAAIMQSKWQQLFPSSQMKELRQLETSLGLPEPQSRDEEDSGLREDSKGAKHYGRHIALTYKDVTVLDRLRSRLLAMSWQEAPTNTGVLASHFTFTKGEGDTMWCISGYVNKENEDALYISLEASGEYGCNPAPGV